MIILSLRTDNPTAEIGLFDGNKELTYKKWSAHRELAETIHTKIEELLKSQNFTWQGLGGIICFKGPGSFTGLRIGLTVANTLAYSLDIPVVATSGEDWQKTGIDELLHGENQKVALPSYGAPVHITQQKK